LGGNEGNHALHSLFVVIFPLEEFEVRLSLFFPVLHGGFIHGLTRVSPGWSNTPPSFGGIFCIPLSPTQMNASPSSHGPKTPGLPPSQGVQDQVLFFPSFPPQPFIEPES